MLNGSWQMNAKELEYVTEKHKETRDYAEWVLADEC